MSRRPASVNQSINVGRVDGEVVAVGPGAVAVGRVELSEHREELRAAIDQLRRELSRTPVDRATRSACEEGLRSIEAEQRKPRPDPGSVESHLERIASRLKSAGVVLRETLALREPIETIAGLVGTSLTLLGIL